MIRRSESQLNLVAFFQTSTDKFIDALDSQQKTVISFDICCYEKRLRQTAEDFSVLFDKWHISSTQLNANRP